MPTDPRASLLAGTPGSDPGPATLPEAGEGRRRGDRGLGAGADTDGPAREGRAVSARDSGGKQRLVDLAAYANGD